jgi:UDP-N-acetyl-D-mannosaminuronic acid dehydrogenase
VIKAANPGYGRDQVPVPSPGVGGPCLTKDPYILASIREPGESERTLSEHGRAVNESMCAFVAERVVDQLVELGKDASKCRLLVCGLAFKGDPETDDLRDSSGVAIALRLQQSVSEIRAHDPVVADAMLEACALPPVDLPDGFSGVDGVVFLNNHRSYEQIDLPSMIAAMAPQALVFDGWHQFRAADVLASGAAVYMGLSFTRRAETHDVDQAPARAPADAREPVV